MTAALRQVLDTASILLTCGTGGVGKTTLAATLGLAAAQLGRRTLVLTIDPAKRLAQALGVTDLASTPQRVWPRSPTTRRAGSGGVCDCLMLDAKRTFDHIIRQYAPDERTARTVLDSPLYQQLSSVIAGSQEYMAMEQLYELSQQAAYDLIILDTPPSSQAIDFFQAPARMIHALSDSMLKLFLAPTMRAGKLGAQLFQKGANTVLKLFGRITGAEMLQEIADLLMSTVSLFGGFGDRAAAVQAMLRAQSTGIILVAVPHNDLIADAITFVRDAKREKMRVQGAIINRMVPAFAEHPAPSALTGLPTPLAEQLHHNWATCHAARAQQQGRIDQLAKALGNRTPMILLDDQLGTLHSIDHLCALAERVRG